MRSLGVPLRGLLLLTWFKRRRRRNVLSRWWLRRQLKILCRGASRALQIRTGRVVRKISRRLGGTRRRDRTGLRYGGTVLRRIMWDRCRAQGRGWGGISWKLVVRRPWITCKRRLRSELRKSGSSGQTIGISRAEDRAREGGWIVGGRWAGRRRRYALQWVTPWLLGSRGLGRRRVIGLIL